MENLIKGKTYFYLDGYRCDEFGNELGSFGMDIYKTLKGARKRCMEELEYHNSNVRVNECIAVEYEHNDGFVEVELSEIAYHTPLTDGGWDVDKLAGTLE